MRAACAVHLDVAEPALGVRPLGGQPRAPVCVAGAPRAAATRHRGYAGAQPWPIVPRLAAALQHVFIPILPKSLLDYLLAPMPYVIGIDRSHAADLDRMSASMSEVRKPDKQAGGSRGGVQT